MKIAAHSYFKNPETRDRFFGAWFDEVQRLNGFTYERLDIPTSLGNTVVWGMNTADTDKKALVIFPGFRTCSMFWDLDNGLAAFRETYRVYLVDTNGQPCLSEGNSPEIKSDDYGHWAVEVLDCLGLSTAAVAGASFGGLVCLKLCMVAPQRVTKAILLNPGCLQPFSLTLKNLYYNFLPLISPTRKNITTFLKKAVFFGDHHMVSEAAFRMIVDFELFAITQYTDKTQKPYGMKGSELERVDSDVYLIVGENDLLFPWKKSVEAAQSHLVNLKEVHLLQQTGHGIETSPEAMALLAEIMAK
jgi:pimeloyl-ACP methyl ester carboxylesterase